MSSAWFTLLGVALTATVTVAGLVVKHYWDVQAERRQAARERDVGEVEHRRTLERLKLEQEEARGRDLRNLRRDIYARFLSGTQVIYRNIVAIRRERRANQDDDAYRIALVSIDPADCQVALEEVRLVGGPESANAADRLWYHLRSHEVVTGIQVGAGSWQNWKAEYWHLRWSLVAQARDDLDVIGGLPLDVAEPSNSNDGDDT